MTGVSPESPVSRDPSSLVSRHRTLASRWSQSPRRRDLLLLFGLCFLCFFWRLGAVGLFDFNEGLYSEAAREMFLRGDYVTARVNGLFFFDKPPLALWSAALAFHLFGVTEFAARLPVAVVSTLLVFLTYLFGSQYFGRRAGWMAAAMLALNPLMLGTARQMTMDIHQSFWFASAMICFFCGYVDRTSRAKGWYYGFWASCGLAFLAKSVPGLFPLFIVLVFIVLEARFRMTEIWQRIKETRPLSGSACMLAIIVPWFYLAWRAHGHLFYEEFWLLHHVKLFNGESFNHAQPIWYYVPMLLVGFFPWSLFLPWALFRPPSSSNLSTDERTARRFVLVWAILVFLIFSAMTSKLVSYLLPMYAAVAILTGDWLSRAIDDSKERGLKFGATVCALIAIGLLIAAPIAVRRFAATPRGPIDLQRNAPPPVIAWGMHSLTLVAIGLSLAAVLIWLGKRPGGVVAIFGTTIAFTALCVQEGLSALQATVNAPLQSLAREAGSHLAAGIPLAIYIGRPRHPSIFFYLPASTFTAPTTADSSSILLEEADKPPVDDFLARNRPAYVLTDDERARALIASPSDGLTVDQRRGSWLLLYAKAQPQHRLSALPTRPSPLQP